MSQPRSPAEIIELKNRNNIAQAEEEYKRQLHLLKAFERDGRQWSGTGARCDVIYETLDNGLKCQLDGETPIKTGGYGTVSRITYRNVTLAKKSVNLARFPREQVDLIKQEGAVGQRLDSHHHVLKHVGTYYTGFDTTDYQLHILTFPVAVCDLQQFLDDCQDASLQRSSLSELSGSVQRLMAMGFRTDIPRDELRHEIKSRLQGFMGCLTEAVAWMHSKKVNHRDLKPANILLRPEQVLLADFGISSVRLDPDRTTTEFIAGYTAGYAAPEVLRHDRYNPDKADVYSLGCIFLHILWVIYEPNHDTHPPMQLQRNVAREKLFREYLGQVPRKPEGTVFRYLPAHAFIPFKYIGLLASMLESDRHNRPDIFDANNNLRQLCRPGDWLYGACCRPGSTRSRNSPNQGFEQVGDIQRPEPVRHSTHPDVRPSYFTPSPYWTQHGTIYDSDTTTIMRKPVATQRPLQHTASPLLCDRDPITAIPRRISDGPVTRNPDTPPTTPPITQLLQPSGGGARIHEVVQAKHNSPIALEGAARPTDRNSTPATVEPIKYEQQPQMKYEPDEDFTNLGNRAVVLSNILSNTTFLELLNVIRGGPLEKVSFVPGDDVCHITFMKASSARWYHAWVSSRKIIVRGRRLKINWDIHSGELFIPNKIIDLIPTRVVKLLCWMNPRGRVFPDWATQEVLDEAFQKFGPLTRSIWSGSEGHALFYFTDIANAIKAHAGILKIEGYDVFTVEFARDPCSNDLLPTEPNAPSEFATPSLGSRKWQVGGRLVPAQESSSCCVIL